MYKTKSGIQVMEKNYIRVTEVLAPYSGLNGIDSDVLKNAADRGTRVHAHCSAFLGGNDPFDLGDEEGYFDSFLKWYQGNYYKKDHRFFDDDLLLTGESDLLIPYGNGYAIIDLKTSYKPSKTWPLQGAAYAFLAERNGYKISRIEFVHLKKDGKPPKSYVYDKNQYIDLFFHCYHAYKYFNVGTNGN